MTGFVRIVEPKLYAANFSVTSVPSKTPTQIASLTLPVGLYVLNASIQWAASFADLTFIQFQYAAVSGIVRASGNSGGGINISQCLQLGETKTINLIAYQGSSTAQTINQYRFTGLRLCR